MSGRDDVELCIRDEVAPALVRCDGLSAHAVRVIAAEIAAREMVIPMDPALTRVRPPRLAAYLAGRYCAARALHAAGRGDVAVPLGDAGAPRWPGGVVGSVSHTGTRALAVVGSAERWRGIGVDCERVLDATAADEIVGVALAEADAVHVAGRDAISWPEFVTIGFSAKEALYKCLRPLVGAFFDFDHAHLVALDRDTRRLRIRLVRDLAPGFARDATFELAFAVTDAHVYTCLALPAIAG